MHPAPSCPCGTRRCSISCSPRLSIGRFWSPSNTDEVWSRLLSIMSGGSATSCRLALRSGSLHPTAAVATSFTRASERRSPTSACRRRRSSVVAPCRASSAAADVRSFSRNHTFFAASASPHVPSVPSTGPPHGPVPAILLPSRSGSPWLARVICNFPSARRVPLELNERNGSVREVGSAVQGRSPTGPS